jgi:hypothetical protein
MRTTRALARQPATIPELAVLEGISVRAMNTIMQNLKKQGRAMRTDRQGARHQRTGPLPYIWERTYSKFSLTSTKTMP